MNALVGVPLHLLIAGGLLAALVLSFMAVFLVPGCMHWLRLRRIQAAISKFEGRTPPGEFRKVFAGDARLTHLWKEYQDSLHVQREEREGQSVPVAVRSTLPAETFFNGQYVVDARLRTEFFKHLPGLFTGIGIIGTFTGLIEGLRQFQVSENTATVRASLESLMHSVGQAFLISASAIGAAMVVTFLEKLLLAALYGRAEEIAHAIDARFDAGAGEDYLSRLVKASEDSSVHSKSLKNALVAELGGLLRDLAGEQAKSAADGQQRLAQRLEAALQQQTIAAREDAQRLGAVIAESIEKSLKEPLKSIAETVKAATGDQHAAASRMLQDVMAGFGERLDGLLGGQISGISDLNQQTAQAMQDATRTLQGLAQSMADTGRQSSEAVLQRLADATAKMEARQDHVNQQTQAFLERSREQGASQQSEMNAQMQATLESVVQGVAAMLSTLAESQQKVAEGSLQREQSLVDHTSFAVSEMSGTVEQALKEMSAASTQMARIVEALTHTTSSSLDKMSAGAEQLSSASRSFATAGEQVSGVMQQATDVSVKLAEASGALVTSATAMQDGLGDYRLQREGGAQLVSEMRATMELARKEASLTADVLSRIQTSADRLGEAQQQADQYLNGVSKVLGEAHQAFAGSVRKTLELANTEFHTKLTTAVGLLASTIGELEVTLGHAAVAQG